MNKQCDIGLIGLAVMGENLALNIAGKGFPIAVYNRTAKKTEQFLSSHASSLPITGAFSLAEFVNSLRRPRKILLMVKAGKPVDDFIELLLPLLGQGDILIDGGNSYYEDTQRRARILQAHGIHYVGLGVSGGEEGALKGPSLMPGGTKAAYDELAPILTAIAAKAGNSPCCSYLGPDGAGHYVKMVHNGIEYGDMQLIAETYFVMKQVLQLCPSEQSKIFQSWNKSDLNSYLIEITADILNRLDDRTQAPMVDLILDSAGQKGTGKWTVHSALDLGVPVPTITEAVYARFLSGYKAERLTAAKTLASPQQEAKLDSIPDFIAAIGDALYASKICSYAQGFALLKAASLHNNWNLQFADIALLWRGGCIIRAQFLEKIHDAFSRNPELPNLLLDPYFTAELKRLQQGWRKVVYICKQLGVPIPAFSASLDYYDAYCQEALPANLIQAQRDYFGAHTYERTDMEGCFHSDWTKLPKANQE